MNNVQAGYLAHFFFFFEISTLSLDSLVERRGLTAKTSYSSLSSLAVTSDGYLHSTVWSYIYI